MHVIPKGNHFQAQPSCAHISIVKLVLLLLLLFCHAFKCSHCWLDRLLFSTQ